ncbi:MAG: hypothetical protein IRZ21_11930 [Thermoleophilaceae bacterium]|nr:hypothetical protein [Thermoleophilaceae bacterium]
MVATIVEWATLGKAILYSLLGGVGVTTAFSVGIAGATRSLEHARDGRHREAVAFGVLAAAGLAVCAGAIAVGIYYTVSKG